VGQLSNSTQECREGGGGVFSPLYPPLHSSGGISLSEEANNLGTSSGCTPRGGELSLP